MAAPLLDVSYIVLPMAKISNAFFSIGTKNAHTIRKKTQKGDIFMFCRKMGTGKSLLTGLMIGAAVGVAGCCWYRRNHRGVKRHMGKALRNMGELVDNVTDMF